MRIKCERCGNEMEVGYRANETGTKPVWYCEKCMIETGKMINPEVREVSKTIAEGGPL